MAAAAMVIQYPRDWSEKVRTNDKILKRGLINKKCYFLDQSKRSRSLCKSNMLVFLEITEVVQFVVYPFVWSKVSSQSEPV